MAERPSYTSLREFVEGLCQALLQAELKRRYSGEEALKRDVAPVVKTFLGEHLDPLGLEYQVWEGVAEEGVGIEPFFAFGAEFVPHLVVDVTETPTLAINLAVVREGPRAGQKIVTAVGEAFLYLQRYPAVLTLICSTSHHAGPMHLLDREIISDLWNRHRIKLVFR